MALYLGGKKFKLHFGGNICRINLLSLTAILNGIQLLSSDNKILLDSNGAYLTVKEAD